MKKFNKDKYLKQLEFKRFYRKYERYFYIGIPCLLVGILGIYFAYSKFTTTADGEVVKTTSGDFVYGDVVINNYVKGQYTVEAPAQATGYKVIKFFVIMEQLENGVTMTGNQLLIMVLKEANVTFIL